jgi:peptidoglycan/LPS O-acetylase OafA/YrhL
VSGAAYLRDVKGTASSDHLDFVRGMAALAVFVHHTIVLLFAPQEGWLLALSTMGSEPPVVMFFVLSGFLVGGSVVRDTEKGRWSWRVYLTNRLTRLWVVLLPAIALTFLWDRATIGITQGIEPGLHVADFVPIENLREGSNFTILLGNIAFTQTILVPTFGSNIPLWSLAYEWWYYVAFPCFWLAAVTKPPLVRLVSVLLGIGALAFAGAYIAAHFLLWLFGAVLAFLPIQHSLGGSRRRQVGFAIVITLALIAVVVAVALGGIPNRLLGRVGIAATFAGLLYVLLHDRRPSGNGIYAKGSRVLAGFSFTLYIVHMPIMVFVRAMWTYAEPWPVDISHAGRAMGVYVAVLLYAYGISRITEARTDRIRRWILGGRNDPSNGR